MHRATVKQSDIKGLGLKRFIATNSSMILLQSPQKVRDSKRFLALIGKNIFSFRGALKQFVVFMDPLPAFGLFHDHSQVRGEVNTRPQRWFIGFGVQGVFGDAPRQLCELVCARRLR